MEDLVEEMPPRSDATVESLTAEMTRRTERLARGVSLWLVGGGILIAVVIGVVVATTDAPGVPATLSQGVTVGLLVLAFFGLPSGLVARYFIRRDIAAAPELVRHGVAYHGRITRHAHEPVGGMHLISVTWREDDREVAAEFDIDQLKEPVLGGDLTVLALPKRPLVGAILGANGFFVGKRSWGAIQIGKRRG